MCVRQRSLCVFSLYSPSSSRSYRHYKCLHHMHIHTYIHHDRGNIYMSGFAVRKDLLSIFFLFRFCCTINVYIAIAQWNLQKPPHHIPHSITQKWFQFNTIQSVQSRYAYEAPHPHTHTHTRTVYNANACMYTWNVHIFNTSLYLSRLFLFLSLSLSVFLFSFVCNLLVHFRSSDQHLIV